MARIDLLTGKVHASIEDRHRSREFIGFLKKRDAAYPSDTAIKVILDNHSAHISKETKVWVDSQPEGRFSFVFTPKHGSSLNLVEGFFSKMARSMLRHIRIASKAELKPGSSPISKTSTVIRSSIVGPTKSPRRRDRSRSMETLY